MLKCNDWECKKCGIVLKEFYYNPNYEPIPACSVCKKPMKPLIGGGKFVLKGTGFHNTDYPR